MTEKTIYLEGFDPVELYGAKNTKLELIKKYFSRLKIIARGNILKAIGNADDIIVFEKKIQSIIDHLIKYNTIKGNHLESILLSDGNEEINHIPAESDIIVFSSNGKPIKPRTRNQRIMVEEARKNDLILATGPAGSGKTYIAIALAVKALKNKEIKRIILSRPAVEAGEQLGFLPGDLKEKLDPYLQPLYDALNDMLPSKKVQDYMEDGTIQIAPLAFMRGRTLANSFVILDEAQNSSYNQMKMFLTRMGENARFVVTGDITQIDLPRKSESGLLRARKILKDIPGIAIVDFSSEDIIRHPLVSRIVNAYEMEQSGISEKKAEKKQNNENQSGN